MILPEMGPTGGMKAWAAKLLRNDVPDHKKEEQNITMVAIMAKRGGTADPTDIMLLFVIMHAENSQPREECLRHLIVAPGHLRSSG